MKNLLCINFNDKYLIDFVYKVSKNNKINKVDLFTAIDELTIFDNFINYYDLLILQDLNNVFNINENSIYILSKKDIEKFYYLESEFLSQTDRLAYIPISVKKRKQIYYEILQYWLNYFTMNKVDLVVFDGVPHMGWDTVCYEVASKLNIKVCYLELTIIQDKVIWNEDYKSFSKTKLENTEFTIDELKKNIGEENLLNYYKDGELLNLGKKLNSKVVKNNDTIIRNIKDFILMFIQLRKYKKFSCFFYSKISRFNYIKSFFKNKIYLYRLKKEYKKHIAKIDLNKKFIFFAMHYQPEKTTFPQGECFQEQLLAIKIISASLPEGWLLYVKEHPTQFQTSTSFWAKNFREVNDYKMISMLKNVQLVPLDMDSKYLIEKAQIVSTITGSIGWEAMIRYNKPIAIFGNIWYAKCNSCFTVSSVDDFKNVIENLKEYDSDKVKKDVLDLILHYQNIFFDSSNGDFYANYSTLPKEVLLQNLVNNFLEKYITCDK